MQASMSSYETEGEYARRGHAPHLSISDESHHVTEAIGYMYDDDYDRRDSKRLSYITSPLGETLSLPSASSMMMEASKRPAASVDGDNLKSRGPSRPTATQTPSYERERNPSSPLHPSPTDTANSSFPLNDIDYESNPAAVAQELSNLAAIRRMSMDVTGDPDLPSFSSNFQVPSIAPSASADENDASRLFWVPARLHPELAPTEFKSFLDSKTEQIKRRSSDLSSLSAGIDRQGSGGGLRRKRSMLSRQIDNSNGYTDGAERLERKFSESRRGKTNTSNPNLQQLEEIVDDSKQQHQDTLALLGGVDNLALTTNEDKPILPPAPPGHSLKRSTRTQYRKGSLKKGERLPYSKRVGRTPETLGGEPPSISPDEPPTSRSLARSWTDPGRGIAGSAGKEAAKQNTQEEDVLSAQAKSTAIPPGDTPNSTFESILEPTAESQPRYWQSRISSNGRSTKQIPPSVQVVPRIVETPPPPEQNRSSPPLLQSSLIPERTSSHDASSASGSVAFGETKSRRPTLQKQQPTQTLTDIASNPSPLPGNSTRTDNLSVIPTLPEEKRSEGKRSKDKKDGEGGRKSSWHWLLGNEEKEKKKDKDKDSDNKKGKPKQSTAAEKAYDKQDNTRLDVLQTSIDSVPRNRESLILERPVDPRLDEERRKESQRKVSGESKKDKESGLLSSIFGGGKKKSGGDHKKSSSRTLSPEPSTVRLIPDEDYPWTRFNIMEERAIYRMAHIKLANPRRPLYSQVLLSNFMYSYLAKVQQMHPQMAIPTSPAQRVQQQQKAKDQPDEFTQYQRYQEEQQYADNSYDDSQMYDYEGDDGNDAYGTHSGSSQSHENGDAHGPGHQHYDNSYSSFGDAAQLDSDDDMW